MYMYFAVKFVGVRVGRSEAGRYSYGTEAYRDRTGTREYHYVSFISRYHDEFDEFTQIYLLERYRMLPD